jgi:hypothetical protein
VVRIIQAEPAYRSVARRVRLAEHRYLQATSDEAEKRVIRTETVSMLFYAAIEKGATFRTVQQRFREVVSLPCGYLPSEVAAYAEFAVYCQRRGRPGIGIRLLERLEAEFQRRESSVAKGVLSYCRSQVSRTLRQLRKG